MKTWTILCVATLALALGCGGNKPTPTEPTTPAVDTAAPAVTSETPAAETTPAAPAEAAKPVIKTPENLQAAYAAKTNAMARNKAFATAADKEKMKNVAKLFRAVARSAEVHAKKLGDMITAAGGTPVAGTETAEVKTTAENLEVVLAAEIVARDTTFMGYSEAAKVEGNADAEKLFAGIKAVEAEHVKLFEDADKNLDAWKKGKKNFWVCPVCGNLMNANKTACGICSAPAKDFEAVK